MYLKNTKGLLIFHLHIVHLFGFKERLRPGHVTSFPYVPSFRTYFKNACASCLFTKSYETTPNKWTSICQLLRNYIKIKTRENGKYHKGLSSVHHYFSTYLNNFHSVKKERLLDHNGTYLLWLPIGICDHSMRSKLNI